MTIIKSILYANFEEPRSRDRDLETLNLRKRKRMEKGWKADQNGDNLRAPEGRTFLIF